MYFLYNINYLLIAQNGQWASLQVFDSLNTVSISQYLFLARPPQSATFTFFPSLDMLYNTIKWPLNVKWPGPIIATTILPCFKAFFNFDLLRSSPSHFKPQCLAILYVQLWCQPPGIYNPCLAPQSHVYIGVTFFPVIVEIQIAIEVGPQPAIRILFEP